MGQRVDADGDAVDVKGDVTWVDEGERLVIDIMCIDVGCTHYLGHPCQSYQAVGRAAVHAEEIKRKHYTKVVLPVPIRAACVFPFIVEASGRLGLVALPLLNRICGTQTYMKSVFLREISMITARYMGLMLKATRDQ